MLFYIPSLMSFMTSLFSIIHGHGGGLISRALHIFFFYLNNEMKILMNKFGCIKKNVYFNITNLHH